MTKPARILSHAFALALLCGVARADVVAREAVTLGALADGADLIARVQVDAVEPDGVRLTVEEMLKGRPLSTLSLPRSPVGWVPGERALVFLREDWRGPRPPRSSWAKVDLAPGEGALLAAARSRLPSVGGDPLALRAALFAQLASPLERIRCDAALDLLAQRRLTASPPQRAALQQALRLAPAAPLLRLAARLPGPDLLPGVLAAVLSARDPEVSAEGAAALAAIDPAAAASALIDALRRPDPAEALAAARALGWLGGPGVQLTLASATNDSRDAVRAEAYRGLARSGELTAVARGVLERKAAAAGDASARCALAVLASCGEGAALVRIARDHADPAMRDLAEALRRDPIEGPRRILSP